MQTALEREQGYSHIKGDPETLFGITVDNWATNIHKLSAHDLAPLPASTRNQLIAIQHASSASERHTLTSAFMQSVGRLLDPLGPDNTQPATGIPKRSTYNPRPGLNGEQEQVVSNTRELAMKIMYNEYALPGHFQEYPTELSVQAIHAAINYGVPRALWNTWKALDESKSIDQKTYDKLPYLTSADVNKSQVFAEHGAGHAYTLPSTSAFIAEAVHHAQLTNPTLVHHAAERFHVWQDAYYKTLANDSPEHEKFRAGWLNAAKESYLIATGQQQPSLQRVSYTHAAPMATSISDAPAPHLQQAMEAVYPLNVQYRDNFVSAAIAIEIPGHGVVMYNIDRATGAITGNPWQMGSEVSYYERGRIGLSGGMEAAALAPHSITWKDEKGHEQSLTLTPELNLTIADAGTPKTLGQDMNMLVARAFKLSDDQHHLVGDTTDNLFLKPNLSVFDTAANARSMRDVPKGRN